MLRSIEEFRNCGTYAFKAVGLALVIYSFVVVALHYVHLPFSKFAPGKSLNMNPRSTLFAALSLLSFITATPIGHTVARHEGEDFSLTLPDMETTVPDAHRWQSPPYGAYSKISRGHDDSMVKWSWTMWLLYGISNVLYSTVSKYSRARYCA